MEDHNEQKQIRQDKLAKIRALGIDPYPYKFDFTHQASELLQAGDALVESGEEVALAGRLMAIRRQGKADFAHIQDNHTRMQVYIRLDEVGEKGFEVFSLCDLGDYVGIHGIMMRTQKGELTLRAKRLTLLSKAIRPLPVPKIEEKDGERIVHDEVRDVEFRYRQRYADLALNADVAKVFLQRTQIIQTLRKYLIDQGYLEVETPVLQTVYGGASATPFTTHHKALNIPLFMRIATELYLKRLVVGGFDRVFEIGKDFRNEGVDRSHNPEFTMVEFYEAYADYNDMMEHFEAIYEACALAIHGTTQFPYQGEMIDVKRPWRRLTMYEAIKEYAGLDVESMDDAALEKLLAEHEWTMEGGYNRGLAIAVIFEEMCEDKLVQPVFITDLPKETTPLCKAHRDNPDLVERFEPYICGFEVGNAYSELNDPQVQKALFEEQVARREGGDQEAHPFDSDFVRSMEYGMPPMGGVGIGIDRMVMLLTNQHSLRDVLFFPTMRPETDSGESH